MKRFTYLILLTIALTISACNFAYAQSRTNRIFRPCPSTTTPASVSISTAGAISLNPCSGQTVSIGTSAITAGSVLFAGTSGQISQDNANFFWNDTSDYLVLGHNTRTNSASRFEVVNTTTSNAMALVGLSNTVNGFSFGTSLAAPTAIPSGRTLLSLNGNGYDSSAYVLGSSMTLISTETWSGSARGSGVLIRTVPNTTTTGGNSHFFQSASLATLSGSQYVWTNSATNAFSGTADTGFARFSAGVISSTNGSTSITGLHGGGAAVASADPLPLPTGRVFHVTGTTSFTNITATNFASGVCVTLIFDGILTATDGGNLVLAGNFVTTANDTLSLCFDGTNWYETGRSVN